MFLFAIGIGIYTYTLFFLGISGYLYEPVIVTCTLVFFLSLTYTYRKYLEKKATLTFFRKSFITNNKLIVCFVMSLFVLAIINLIGVFGPELSFDALWYHLTLPKLYLLNHSVYHISGGLLYYSDMPKLGEMLYVGAIALGNEITAKAVHFTFGVLTTIAIYMFARKFFTPLIAIVAVVVFYSNLVVAWESTTAYVDLIRAFFEVMALWGFINWYQTKKQKWFYLTAVMVGLAVTTKLLAIGSLFIFILLICYILFKKKAHFVEIIKKIASFGLVSLLIPLPWFIFSYIHTGNPVYPFFTDVYSVNPEPLHPTTFFVNIWNVFVAASDPLSPLYMVFLPLVFVTFSKLSKEIKLLVWYSALVIVVWYFTPRTGGGRFLLPYLPALSIVAAGILNVIMQNKKQYGLLLPKFLISLILIVMLITIGYRAVASAKYVPVIIGQQSKDEFLSNNLNFAFGDFYDTDSYFEKSIKSSDRVLLYGFHNLYYIEFPYIHASWVKKGDRFNYVAVQNTDLPLRFSDWQLIYTNAKTMVKLYKPPKGDCKELCVY